MVEALPEAQMVVEIAVALILLHLLYQIPVFKATVLNYKAVCLIWICGETYMRRTGSESSVILENLYGRRGYSGYYSTYRRPGHHIKNTTIYLQTNLYRTADEKLLWAARSETINPTSRTAAIHSFSKAVIKKLKKGGYMQSRASK